MTSSFRDAAVLGGAAGSFGAAALHLAVLPFGSRGLRFFGAGDSLADRADAGSPIPAAVCTGIAGALAAAGLYAVANAGRRTALPWQEPVYSAVTAVYLLRGIAVVPQVALALAGVGIGPGRELVFSAAALALGLLHVPGLRRSADQLQPVRS